MKFLSEFDITVPGIMECRRVEVPEWIEASLDVAGAAIKVMRWVRTAAP